MLNACADRSGALSFSCRSNSLYTKCDCGILVYGKWQSVVPKSQGCQISRRCQLSALPKGLAAEARELSSQSRFPQEDSSARKIAITQLLRIEEEGGFVGRVASSSGADGSRSRIAASDQRGATMYVAEVTRLKRRLDWRLERLTKRPLAQMEPRLLQLLRLGVFEVFEKSLPDHAINEFVNLAKSMVGVWSKGFVNAVLREACRNRERGDMMVPAKPPQSATLDQWAEALAIVYSHPTWMVKRWLKQRGLQVTEQILKANNRIPQYGLRLNSLKKASSANILPLLPDVKVAQSPFLPEEFLRVSALQSILRKGFVKDGLCMVQDEAAGLVVSMLDPQPGESILDACAAPGGKTLFAAARMQNQGKLVAMDIYEKRLRPLARAADSCGVGEMLKILPGSIDNLTSSELRFSANDSKYRQKLAKEPLTQFYDEDVDWEDSLASLQNAHAGASGEDLPQFDRVLLDVPCSGHGVLAKRADLRWRRQPQDIEQLTTVQASLLSSGARLVKPGGLLVYSTCSIEPEENEQQIEQFLSEHKDFKLEPAPESMPQEVLDGSFLRTMPHLHEIDGAFAARLRRA